MHDGRQIYLVDPKVPDLSQEEAESLELPSSSAGWTKVLKEIKPTQSLGP